MNGANKATSTSATTAPTISAPRHLRRDPENANSGASASGANFAAAPRPSSSPRTGADRSATSAHTHVMATSASFELQLSANSVYGNAAHAYASVTPSQGPRIRHPRRSSPSIVRTSNAIAAAWAEGRSPQVPSNPSAATNGTYAR